MVDQKLLGVLNHTLNNINVKKYLALLKKHYKITYEHSLRVGLLSVYLGYENNLTDEKIKLLCYAGLLHDVGKLSVQRSILSKKSKLNKKEWEKIKSHPRKGFLKLKEQEFNEVRKIIIMHHEYCACPYPRNCNNGIRKIKQERRKKNGYKELAQILSAVDMYDALSNKRAYHEPLDCESIEKIMKEQFKGKKKYIKQLIKKCFVDFENKNITKKNEK